MNIEKYLDKENLHHAYLVEGSRDEIIPEILEFLKSLKIKTEGNPDVVQMHTDTFKIDDARNLKIYGREKGYTSAKKIFIISANNFLSEAQNSLLKLFEEPIENTYFFIVAPDASVFIKTLSSRLYFISTKSDISAELKDAEKFIKMPLKSRLDFIKELLTTEELEDEEGLSAQAGNEVIQLDSIRSKALKFLNALESVFHKKMPKTAFDTSVFEHIFKVREFLRMPGSSPKTLMESVALITSGKF
ncbi:MAG TPA: hypothetical protein VGO63_03875 [Candidatus Paceibacterota bacterium]|jgi:DNA polymerase III delta prime subunit|nr:hypothetical protein [Candidatus Paceibacterota bacterium]